MEIFVGGTTAQLISTQGLRLSAQAAAMAAEFFLNNPDKDHMPSDMLHALNIAVMNGFNEAKSYKPALANTDNKAPAAGGSKQKDGQLLA